MTFVHRLTLAMVVFGMSVVSAQASVIVYTDESSFLAALGGSMYTETFDSLPTGPLPGPLNFSGSGFAYTASVAANSTDFFPFVPPSSSDVWLGTVAPMTP